MRICPPDPFDSLPLQSPRDPAQSRGDTEVGTKEFVSIVRTDPFTTPLRVQQALRRHATGDWGDLSPEDRQENNLSAREGFRILSAYIDSGGTKF